jgi:apolipoprotein D and lipocalin family protein
MAWFTQGFAQTAAVKTVAHVDLQRYAGKWYEVARIPNRFQKKCSRDVSAEYSFEGDAIKVHNLCVNTAGRTTGITGKAKVVDQQSNAKLKVTFFWPFYGDYWILGLDPDYRWALVGTPNHKYLWVLSRTKTLPQVDMDQARRIAEQNGFLISNLVLTPQSEP